MMAKVTFRRMVSAAAAVGLVFFVFAAPTDAQNYPTKAIEIIVPFPPGGSVEQGTRPIIAAMSEILGQPIILTSKPGAGGALGAEHVAKARPDGYTILSSSNSANVAAIATNLNTPYSVNDFAPLGQYATLSLIIGISGNSPWKTAQDLIREAKNNPNRVTFGTGGVGAGTHLFCELFNRAAGIRVSHVPFRGDSPAVTALAGGHVGFACASVVGSLSQLEGKLIRAVAVSGAKRDPQIPEVPTVGELGMESAKFQPWMAFFAPKNLPQPILAKLSDAFRRAIETPSVKEALTRSAFNVEYADGAVVQRNAESEFRVLRQLAEEGGFITK